MSANLGNLTRAAIGALTLAALSASSEPARAASKEELAAHAHQSIQDLYRVSVKAKDLAGKAAGILVFPNVVKAGFIFGGEYGEGTLEVGGSPVSYYNILSASFGLQAGVQDESIALMFMTPEALSKFRASHGWKAGVDGSIALVTLGAGGEVDSETLEKPIVAFVYNNKGLMANLTLEGSKISKIDR
jgi:lipid-binding SYLF domain-containing protein